MELTNSRGQGFNGPLPITVVQVVALLDLYGIVRPVTRRYWWRMIHGLDMTYLKEVSDG